ncbi:integrator complex subunit 6 isoform X1 [Ixodes scapularis]|uniref:integrator complex subunit 6 isoform X1 n=1 Tax=Ixodes scapularis TaxID=6945 RepID=UPI001A9F9141|nr:integrator complex subunit 6 isoform X1 [Ixodes scapularis]
MTIIVFLVDTSASMNQRTYLGARLSVLDVAKDAVERFIKIRQRDSASRGDRYMLLTFEEPPSNIKAGWKENHATFMAELKNLQATGLTTLGPALKNAFDLLNINRMQTGIDTYGQGRCPFYLEPSILVVITDGSRLSSSAGVHDELTLPMHSAVPGSELTKEPFRWDQRMFALVLRMAGTQPPPAPQEATPLATDPSAIDDMCQVTGGRSFCVTSHRALVQSLEALVQKVQGGVVINFEKVGADPPDVESAEPGWQNCRRLIYVQRSAQKGYSVGHWPIPEAFWPDMNSPSLPPRSAHPNVRFSCAHSDPMVIDNLPFDKYELEPSPLTQFILGRKQPTVAWQVFVGSSHRSGGELGHAFGYLKASTNLTCVNLFVLPYNYPVLLPLLEDLFKVHRCKPTREWKVQFDAYLKNMPLYYAGPLKRALQRMGAHNLVPDSMENCLSYTVLNYLKRLKNQAKAEYEKLVSAVGGNNKPVGGAPDNVRASPGVPRASTGEVAKLSELPLSWNPALRERLQCLRQELNDFAGFGVALVTARPTDALLADALRNPFDIGRSALLDQVARMRAHYLHATPGGVLTARLHDAEQLHSLPVSQMGNYQEYLKRMPTPLREIESTPVRQHMFGNPFKIEKRMMVDEADLDMVTSQARGHKRAAPEPPGGPRAKRRPGPLPRDFGHRSRSPTPPTSPTPNGPSPDGPQSPGAEAKPTRAPPPMGEPEEEASNGWAPVEPDRAALGPWEERNGQPSAMPPEPWRDNGLLRGCLLKEVRRPGRNFERLFELLGLVQGGLETRVCMVRHVIHEAGRFKRRLLMRLLRDFEQRLVDAAAFPSA